ncbi:MAG TPA: hypothetical protein VFB29_00490 [Pseudolabrys sp.]|nr:hypothetical protein [Pseudolabrys sp.]
MNISRLENMTRRAAGNGGAVAVALLSAILLVLFLVWALSTYANAHESWINRGGYKNGAGEWCCGDYDCKSYGATTSTATGWMLDGELVPYDEAMPITPPDGKLTVCRRPDGTRRCVFGIKPGL